ncbi:IS2 repressor TnpA [Citrobacter werkmanii]|uniref:IS2 repressor TnpA n=1 Tax=Citrobacter werkmanii TaxID=67827 RepID=A0A9N8GUS9_9ENTR|nr:IS2 repressor TnpA [Citrobacter werkmanii]CAB5607590.1 IS2 repressor TnpA [Citrobacter werkmanii]CAB5608038.1 IS2 repressor TnpA [Citrobacter werkmanii]CAB5622744.1 IS2 repressor TnpA [Citrobacter werkmanii]CAB5629721.1 IS2 repressor TnpA [Citrobacter werkmanii]
MMDVLGPEKRRRRSLQKKIAIVQQSFEPGMTVLLPVSCSCGVSCTRKVVSPPLLRVNRLYPRRNWHLR